MKKEQSTNDKSLHVAVPTSTIIFYDAHDPYRIIIFESLAKFPGKLVIPGGKLKYTHYDAPDNAIIEGKEEVGITDVVRSQLKLLGVVTTPGRDMRRINLEKFLDGNPVPEGIDPAIEITSHHCADMVFMAPTHQNPLADGNEAKRAFWYDVRNHDDSRFALDHGKVITAYALMLKTGVCPGII